MFGVLAVNKPSDWTSRDVVNRIQKLVRPSKVGHTGTLDPMATGVLLIAVGPATRLVEFSHAAAKCYEGDFELARASETLDTEGDVQLVEDASAFSEEELLVELENWKGAIEQTPPKYSAINIGGRRAYDLARAGKEFEVPKRRVTIHNLSLESFSSEQMTLQIECSSGTYIRTLGFDVAHALGSSAVMSRLVRTSIGDISLEDCVELDGLQSTQDIVQHLRSPLELVSTFETCILNSVGAQRIRNGIGLTECDFVEAPNLQSDSCTSDSRWAAVDESGMLVAILELRGKHFRSLRVFQAEVSSLSPALK